MGARLHSDLRFAAAQVQFEKRSDGTILLRSPQKLGAHARAVGEWLVRWAADAPERVFLAERAGDAWRKVSYREALDAARRIGQALLERGMDASRPVAILSDNGVDHALLALGAMHAGIPVAPISPAYSLMSRDFAKLKAIFELLQPGLVYAADPQKFAPALAAVGATPTPIAELLAGRAGARVDQAFAAVGPATVAKILFTSGSTGIPKGVVNTHRMLTANQQQLAQAWPFVEDRPPVVIDWLPWNHTFGGNHNFNMVLRNGGTLYVDGGKPTPERIGLTVQNLHSVSPTMYFNVPRGFDALLPHLERDEALRASFFKELDLVFYAAAALPQPLWERLEAVSIAARGSKVTMTSAWGSTETSPLITSVHFPIDRAGVIGLPAPGIELKLVPFGDKLEMRVKGPNVTPGAWRRGEVVPAALDEEGFLSTGDAGRLTDEGVVFDGRIAENFKLSSGTWVSVGEVRMGVVGACSPWVMDAVIAGHDRDFLTALIFPSPAAGPQLRAQVIAGLKAHNAMHPRTGTRIVRAVLLAEPPSIDHGEMTDKGYINQRAVLTRRAVSVEALYAPAPGPDVLVIEA